MKQLFQRNNASPANIDDPRYPRSKSFKEFRYIYIYKEIKDILPLIVAVLYTLLLFMLALSVFSFNVIIQIVSIIAIFIVMFYVISWTVKDRKQEKRVLALREERQEEQRRLEVESQLPGFKLNYILRGHSNVITNIAWSPTGSILASSSHDQTVRLWNAQNGQPLHIFRTDVDQNITWSPDGLFLATGYYSTSNKNVINIWRTQSGKLNDRIKEKNGIIDIKWSPDGSTIASLSGTKKNNIRIWDVEKKQLLYTLRQGST